MSDLDENITNILGITELEKKQGKFNDPKKQMQYELIQEQVKEAYDRGYTDKAIKADKFLEEQVRLARIDEINSWFDMPKHYPGEEYLDQPFAKVKCKTPVRVQYQTLDSRFTYALLTRIKALKGEK